MNAHDNVYAIATERFGQVLLVEESIAKARVRAKRMFGVGPACVARVSTSRTLCDVCESRPCCCITPAGRAALTGHVGGAS